MLVVLIYALILTIILATPILWLASEFKSDERHSTPWIRVLLGLGTCASACFVVYTFMTVIENEKSYTRNIGIRFTIKNLLDSTVTGLESGKEQEVLAELKEMQAKYKAGKGDWRGYEHPINEMAYEYAEKFPADDKPDVSEVDETPETENTD